MNISTIFVLLAMTLCSLPVQATSALLTAEEAAYVRQVKPLTVCVDPDWAPFEWLTPQGKHEGIAADLLQRVSSRVGLQLQVIPVSTWQESLKASQTGRCKILSFLNQTPERERWLTFTAPMFVDPNVIITREEHAFIADLKGMTGQSVAIPAGTMVEERIRHEFPNLKVIPTRSEAESILLVESRKADMTVRTLIGAAYAIKKEGLFNLKIAGQLPDYPNRLRIGVIKQEPMLREILDKGIATLTPDEKEEIWNRHVSINVQKGIDYSLVWQISAAAALLLAVFYYWNRKLRHLNQELKRLSVTDRLTSLFNRVRLDETLDQEITRAERYQTSFSVILLDVDHFKLVNDTQGHPIGDQVLIVLSQLLRTHTRETDIVGRWGGEEFLIICPQTSYAGALTQAENLRSAVAQAQFPLETGITISLGVSAYAPGDHSNDLIARADMALYEAKSRGRNRIAGQMPTPSRPQRIATASP